MRAFILKIELEGSDPLIWRRVIMPAGGTYKRLHDVIQVMSNFKSGLATMGYGYHFYEFELTEDNTIVTDNEEMYLEHQHYKKNKKMFEERLKTMPPNMLEFEKCYQERLNTNVRKPTTLKIDDYLEKHKNITYNYDLGDGWQFTVTLENIVDDYYFGYPTLLDGAETVPPEDVGGIYGYYEFLKAYRDPKNPEHGETREWADSQGYREYNPERINSILKMINYKKTEWDKINHEKYRVIEDKYRK